MQAKGLLRANMWGFAAVDSFSDSLVYTISLFSFSFSMQMQARLAEQKRHE